MKTSITSSFRLNLAGRILTVAACAAAFVLAQGPARAADAAPVAPAAAAQALPLTSSFKKGKPGENGGAYVLRLKNTSGATLKVNVTIHQSVISHSSPKTRVLPEHSIDAGKSWSVKDLAAGDKITISAEGFSPLELTTP